MYYKVITNENSVVLHIMDTRSLHSGPEPHRRVGHNFSGSGWIRVWHVELLACCIQEGGILYRDVI